MSTDTRPTCFVFGSNPQGRHGKGAALVAYQLHGAVYGQATGLMGPGRRGYSYGIVTKELRHGYPPIMLDTVRHGVDNFLEFARSDEGCKYVFNVTEIGCGLAGFAPEQIAPLFQVVLDHCALYSHVHLPARFVQAIVKEQLDNGRDNKRELVTYSVDDLLTDLCAYSATFDCWLAVEKYDEPVVQEIHDRYYPVVAAAVKEWRAQFPEENL